MLEGGYDLMALQHCTTAVLAELAGLDPDDVADVTTGSEAMTSGETGRHAVADVCAYWSRLEPA
jgi:hypothetical protein